MISVSLGPEWPKARERLTRLKTISPRIIRTIMVQGAQQFRNILVDGLASGTPGGKPAKALQASTLATRRLRGRRGTTPLKDRGNLLRSVRIIKSTNSIFVGIPANARGPQGQPMLAIAKAQEFGAGPYKVTITPAMRKFFAVLARESGHKLGSVRRGRDSQGRFRGKRTKGVLIVRIPKRPFIAPAERKFRQWFRTWAPRELARLVRR